MTRRNGTALLGAALVVAVGAAASGAAPALATAARTGATGVNAATATRSLTMRGKPRTVVLPPHGARGARVAGAVRPSLSVPTIQTFTSSFKTGGVTYPYTMVGTNPTGPAATTTVKTAVRPVSVYVDDAGISVSVPTATLNRVTSSGLFTTKAFPGGTGQYGDVFMRTQFWAATANGTKAWHVRLGTPAVRGQARVTIGPGLGAVQIMHKVKVAMVDVTTFDQMIQPLVTADGADTFTQIVLSNVVLCDFGCGIGGYHSVVVDSAGPHTYSVQSVLDPAVYGAASGFYGLSPMSHELAEWLDDPYAGNRTPSWSSPLSPQYGCSNALEVGDPLVGINRVVGAEIYEDEAYLPWFSHQAPSTSQGHRYSLFGTLTDVAPGCTG